MVCVEQVNFLYIESRLTASFNLGEDIWPRKELGRKEKHGKFVQINPILNSAVSPHVISGRPIAGKWPQPIAQSFNYNVRTQTRICHFSEHRPMKNGETICVRHRNYTSQHYNARAHSVRSTRYFLQQNKVGIKL